MSYPSIWDFQGLAKEFPSPSKQVFLAGRRRRFGQTNPDRMDDPFWKHMVQTQREPYFLREEYGVEEDGCTPDCAREASAIWSFRRIGMTTTPYKDRWLISIGGEHDDWYDPDFLIYNDVVIQDALGDVRIYGYPKDVFPPTDFHTATLLDGTDWQSGIPDELCDGIVIVGGLGYTEDREFWRTPVYHLDLNRLYIHPLECSGDELGWINGHRAALVSRGRIYVEGGERLTEAGKFVPNEDEYFLDLGTRQWTKRDPDRTSRRGATD